MKRAVALLAAAGALLSASTAGAQADVAVTACGASGCATIAEGDAGGRRALAFPRGESAPPPPVAEYYSLRFVAGGDTDAGWSAYYVPAARLLATTDVAGERTGVEGVVTWTAVPARGAAVLARALRGLEPFAEPEVTSAEVDLRPVADPRGYLLLFEVESAAAEPEPRGDWRPVVLTANRPNPWTNGTRLAWSPSGKLLRRGQEIVRLPDAMAADLAARAPLDGGDDDGTWTGALVGGAIALAAVLVAAAVTVARRAPRRRSPAAR